MSSSLWPHGLQPTKLLCPWNSPGNNTGVGSHSLLQGSSQPRDQTQVSCIAGIFLILWATREVLLCVCVCVCVCVYLYSEELKTGSQRGSCTPVFIIALFPIASRWKLLKYPLIDEQIRGYTYNGLSFSLKNGGNPVTCYNTGEFWTYYAK